MVGNVASHALGSSRVTAFSNGVYVVNSTMWDANLTTDVGAVTLGLANGSVTGSITNMHSVIGVVANQGQSQVFGYDAERNQLAVGQRASNRVVLHRTGIATSLSITSATPAPSIVNQPVTFIATINASPFGPSNGQVTFRASGGEFCIDNIPTTTSTTTAQFSCDLTFTLDGISTVRAEYTGSTFHAYSGSAPATHTVFSAASNNIFANGFEAP